MCILCLQTSTVIQIRKTQRDTKGCEFSTAYNYPYLQFDVQRDHGLLITSY